MEGSRSCITRVFERATRAVPMFPLVSLLMLGRVGMSAVRFPGHIQWEIGIVALSVIIGIAAATAGLIIFFRFEGLRHCAPGNDVSLVLVCLRSDV